MTAQGNALGSLARAVQALKGRDKADAMRVNEKLRVACLAVSIPLALYLPTASFVIDQTYKSRWSDLLYAPVYWAIQEDWFGRDFAHWYYYRVCRMNLLVPISIRSEQL